MKNIYIVDDYKNSPQSGVGTFLQVFLMILKGIDCTISVFKFNSIEKYFCITHENQLQQFMFPPFPSENFNNYYTIIKKFMLLYIEDSSDNIFIFNYSPCGRFIQSTKESYPKSKIIYIAHSLGWSEILQGDYNRFKKIINTKNAASIDEKYKIIQNCYQEEQKTYSYADQIVCLCKDTFNVIKSIYKVKENKLTLISNGLPGNNIKTHVTTLQLKNKLHLPANEKILLFVGRISKSKGAYILLEAFRSILKEHPESRLVLAGQIHDYNIFSTYSDLIAKISILGYITKNRLDLWYQIADIGIIPSYTEQCSYTALEMMSHKLPIVASDGFGIKNMFQDKENAEIVRIGNREKPQTFVKNLSNSIMRLLSSNEECMFLGLNGYKNLIEKYSFEQMNTKYIDLLK